MRQKNFTCLKSRMAAKASKWYLASAPAPSRPRTVASSRARWRVPTALVAEVRSWVARVAGTPFTPKRPPEPL